MTKQEEKMSIKIGILGYGNLGRGVEGAVFKNSDMELKAVFTRRPPETVRILTDSAKVYYIDEAHKMADEIDVMILCGGSASDLPVQTPEFAGRFHVVDSFDTHSKINEHFERVDKASREGGKVSIISSGWDPGMFSINRLYANSIISDGADYTFWGKGISQGHSDAIRRIAGVKDAKQYTIPVQAAQDAVRRGERPVLTARDKHIRECFVVALDGADIEKIREEIVNMPDYFADYDTIVHFISSDELAAEHSGLPHGGSVIFNGSTGFKNENKHVIEYQIKLSSNPEFTAGILAAYARAAYRLGCEGAKGCRTVFDIAPAYLSPFDGKELRRRYL